MLEIPQEFDDPVEGKVAERQPGDLAAFVRGGEGEEQPDGVPVAAHRRGPQALDGDQVVGEKRVQDRPDRLVSGHCVTSAQAGCAKNSNRRLASSSSCGAMVRYTAGETGSPWPRKGDNRRSLR